MHYNNYTVGVDLGFSVGGGTNPWGAGAPPLGSATAQDYEFIQ